MAGGAIVLQPQVRDHEDPCFFVRVGCHVAALKLIMSSDRSAMAPISLSTSQAQYIAEQNVAKDCNGYLATRMGTRVDYDRLGPFVALLHDPVCRKCAMRS